MREVKSDGLKENCPKCAHLLWWIITKGNEWVISVRNTNLSHSLSFSLSQAHTISHTGQVCSHLKSISTRSFALGHTSFLLMRTYFLIHFQFTLQFSFLLLLVLLLLPLLHLLRFRLNMHYFMGVGFWAFLSFSSSLSLCFYFSFRFDNIIIDVSIFICLFFFLIHHFPHMFLSIIFLAHAVNASLLYSLLVSLAYASLRLCYLRRRRPMLCAILSDKLKQMNAHTFLAHMPWFFHDTYHMHMSNLTNKNLFFYRGSNNNQRDETKMKKKTEWCHYFILWFVDRK